MLRGLLWLEIGLLGLVAWRRRGVDPTPEEHAEARSIPVQRTRRNA